MKEAYLYKKISDREVQCRNCAHYCTISSGKRGFCGVRENREGVLYALNYGKAIACNIDNIEKKPFFHFFPGESTLSLATVGCNFACKNCQNYDISQGHKEVETIPGENIPPSRALEVALENKVRSISYTYTEPTMFLEYALDIMELATKKGVKNMWVSNGFLTPEAVEAIIPYIDGINIDIKSYSEDFYKENCSARLAPVLETAESLKRRGVWVEITTLLIPGLSDSPENIKNIARFIKENLGSETPWHLSRFSGELSWRLKNISSTSESKIKEALDIGKEEGLEYVYGGNTENYLLTSTFCSRCGRLALKRVGYNVFRQDKKGKCEYCSKDLNLILE